MDTTILVHAQISNDPTLLIQTHEARTLLASQQSVTMRSESMFLTSFGARVYINRVGGKVVSVRIDRPTRYFKLGTRLHGSQVYPSPSQSSTARIEAKIHEQRGW